MANIKYKKGELLFEGDITTTHSSGEEIIEDYSVGVDTIQDEFYQKFHQTTLIVEFDGVEYTCQINGVDPNYGAYSMQGVDFTDYPFGFEVWQNSGELELYLYTENPGTYNLKIYEAVADISNVTFKKGELLLNETFETSKPDEQYPFNVANKDISINIIEDIVIIDFNGIEYTCINLAPPTIQKAVYGGYTEQGPDFTEYPFAFGSAEVEGQNIASLVTPDSGTYTLKIYAAVEDTDSTPLSPTDFIIAYLMKSPTNSNWNVLSSLLGDGDWSRLKAYVETTPKNMNRQVLKALLGNGSSGSSAVVGTAVVGTDTVG